MDLDQVKMIAKRVTGMVNLMTHSCVSWQSVCTGASQILVIITQILPTEQIYLLRYAVGNLGMV